MKIYKYRSVIFILIFFVLISPAIAQEELTEQIGFWKRTFSSPWIISTFFLFLFATINYLIDLFKKDKILKKLLKKYVVFELKDGRRFRGTMRVEANGIEIISEESRQRGHAPSYLFNKGEMGNIKAYIRYIDAMNETEKRERDWDLDRVYHPNFTMRLQRKIRNFGVALRNSVNKTIETIWTNVRKTTAFQPLQKQRGDVQVGQEIDALEKELLEYAMQESYDRLIERFVGTKVKVKVEDADYIVVLKEYNDNFMFMMDVHRSDGRGYADQWKWETDAKNGNHRDDRGIRCRVRGRTLIVENNAPYDIEMWGIRYRGDRGNSEQKFGQHGFAKRIPAFSVERIQMRPNPKNHNVGPFVRIVTREERNNHSFKKIEVEFRSFRNADIIFPRKYCRIVESAEKYETELLDLDTLTDKLLNQKENNQITIADSHGKEIKGISVIHGYVTNVNEDRIDLTKIDRNYAWRWSIERAFEQSDQQLRKVAPLPIALLPSFRDRMKTQTALVSDLADKKTDQRPITPILYSPIKPRTKHYKKPELPLKLIALTGNVTNVEFSVISQFSEILDHPMHFDETKNLRNAPIARSHIVWIGHGEIYKNGYRLSIDSEHRIKNFVSKGGIVIASGQDMSNLRRRSGAWIPEPLIGAERDETTEFSPTRIGKKMFHFPNRIDQGGIKMDDMWSEWSSRFQLIAKANGGKDAAILLLKFQAGLYIVTSLKNETRSDVEINEKMIENLIYFAVDWFDRQKHQSLYYV